MGLHYTIDTAAAHVRITGTGPLSMPEMTAAVDQVAADPRFDSHFSVILDIRDAHYTAQLNDGDEFVAALRRREADFQNLFVLVVPDSLHFLGTLFCLLAKASGVDRMRCFTSIEEALESCASRNGN